MDGFEDLASACKGTIYSVGINAEGGGVDLYDQMLSGDIRCKMNDIIQQNGLEFPNHSTGSGLGPFGDICQIKYTDFGHTGEKKRLKAEQLKQLDQVLRDRLDEIQKDFSGSGATFSVANEVTINLDQDKLRGTTPEEKKKSAKKMVRALIAEAGYSLPEGELPRIDAIYELGDQRTLAVKIGINADPKSPSLILLMNILDDIQKRKAETGAGHADRIVGSDGNAPGQSRQ